MAFFVPGLALREFRHIMLQGNCMKFTAFFLPVAVKSL